MSDMILSGMILLVVVLGVRCYCGRKYGVAGGCGHNGCHDCPHAKDCGTEK